MVAGHAAIAVGATVGTAAVNTIKWTTDYSRTAMFTALTGGALRSGHRALEDTRIWVEEITGVSKGSSAGILGMARAMSPSVSSRLPLSSRVWYRMERGPRTGD
jgi:hypothetical protein